MPDLSRAYAGKNVLITGGLGFIGSNLAHRLVALDAHVTIVDALLPCCGGSLFNIKDIKDRVEVHVADVGDLDAMSHLVREKDFVFNLAGHVSHIDSLRDPRLDLHINCRCQLSVLETCRKSHPSAAILFAGTRGQYGRIAKLPVTEEHPLKPIDINGINKLAGELYHLLYHRLFGLHVCCLRLTNTYGPRHTMKNSRHGYLNWFIRLAMDDQVIQVYGEGSQLRDFNHVDDVVTAMLLALASPRTVGRTFNLGSKHPLSVLESAEAVVSACGSGRIQHTPYPEEKRAIEVGSYWADYGSFRSATGWEPTIDFREGLTRTVEFYREHRQHYWSPTDDPASSLQAPKCPPARGTGRRDSPRV